MLIKINGSDRVRRGGSWSGFAISCEVAYRGYYYPFFRVNDIGFRVLRRYNNVNKNKWL